MCSECTVEFYNVHFIDCPVLAMTGAEVHFENCTFSNSDGDRSVHARAIKSVQAAVSVKEACTTIYMKGCDFRCGDRFEDAVRIAEGAQATIENTSSTGAGFSVMDPRAHLTCRF